MGLNTIFSVYMQGRGNGWPIDYLSSLKPRVVKIQDAKQSEIDAIRSLTPDSTIINRIYIDDSVVSEQIRNDPHGAAELHHDLILSKSLTGVDYYQIQNEQHQHPPELSMLDAYYVRLMDLAVDSGYRTTVIDCSVGNLHVGESDPGDWRYVFNTLEYAQSHGFVVNVHQYSRESFWNTKTNPETGELCYPNDWYLHRLEQTAMPVLDDAGFDRLVYVVGEFGLSQLLSVCPGEVQKPGGWQTWKSHDEYRSDLINVMSYLLQWSDRILGYCCYLTHAFAPWQTHEMLEMNQDLANHYLANPQNIMPIGGGGNGDVLFQARVTADTLNVRNAPPVDDVLQPVVGQVHNGDIVDVYEIADQDPDDWWRIVHDGLIGWSSSAYMVRIGGDKTLEERVSDLEAHATETDDTLMAHAMQIDANRRDIERLDAELIELTRRVAALEDGGGVIPPPSGAKLSDSIGYMGLQVEGGFAARIGYAFTTYHGQWTARTPPHIYDIEDWARARYLANSINLGGGQNFYVRVEDKDGHFLSEVEIDFHRVDGDQIVETQTRITRPTDGWCDIPVFYPAFWVAEISGGSQQLSKWSLPNSAGGMPGREHVSLFQVIVVDG